MIYPTSRAEQPAAFTRWKTHITLPGRSTHKLRQLLTLLATIHSAAGLFALKMCHRVFNAFLPFTDCTEFMARRTSDWSLSLLRPPPLTLGDSHTHSHSLIYQPVYTVPQHLAPLQNLTYFFFSYSCLTSSLKSDFLFIFLGSYVFLLDTGLEIFIWRGANATLSGTTKAR